MHGIFVCTVVLLGSGITGEYYDERASTSYRKDYTHYSTESECYTGDGSNYVGPQNYTNTGKPCIDWEQTDFNEDVMCVYCRNPNNNKHGPWCYTDGIHLDWEYCNTRIPKCGKVYKLADGGSITYETFSWMKSDETNISLAVAHNISTNKTGEYSLLHLPGHPSTYLYLGYVRSQPGTLGHITLQWKYEEFKEAVVVNSDLIPYRYLSILVLRNATQLSLVVNDVTYTGSISAAEFDFTGKFVIGTREEKLNWEGCMTNLEYNGVRPLDNFEPDSSRKADIPLITVTGRVEQSENCLFVAPGNFDKLGYAGTTHTRWNGMLLALSYALAVI